MQENTQTAGDVVFHVFDPVTVQLSIDRSNVQHMKLSLNLVEPKVSKRLFVSVRQLTCKIICGAPTTLVVKGLMIIMMMNSPVRADLFQASSQ